MTNTVRIWENTFHLDDNENINTMDLELMTDGTALLIVENNVSGVNNALRIRLSAINLNELINFFNTECKD